MCHSQANLCLAQMRGSCKKASCPGPKWKTLDPPNVFSSLEVNNWDMRKRQKSICQIKGSPVIRVIVEEDAATLSVRGGDLCGGESKRSVASLVETGQTITSRTMLPPGETTTAVGHSSTSRS